MSHTRTAIKVKARSKSSQAGLQAFQTELLPNHTYEGDELHRRFAEFMGLPSDGYRAGQMISAVESFIRSELEKGNRLDFGLVSFYPRLSAALSARDADPEDDGVFVRGAVKARKKLSASLAKYLVPENPKSDLDIYIGSVLAEGMKEYDMVVAGDTISIAGRCIGVDVSRSDEGVWLEKPIKRRGQKHTPVAVAEILGGDLHLVKCRFSGTLPLGRYMLTVGTRGGNGPDYRLRTVHHQVAVG